MSRRKLDRSFFEMPTLTVARSLLGNYLVHSCPEGRVVGRIVETEAYVGFEDLASHAARGKTLRNGVMFGPAGYAYVYMVYGMHHCLNIVTERDGFPAAALVRAVEPVAGIDVMRQRRHVVEDRLLTNGPAKLCEAFGIDRSLNGIDVCGRVLFVEQNRVRTHGVVASKRVGVDYAGAWKDRLWRFSIEHNGYVSRMP